MRPLAAACTIVLGSLGAFIGLVGLQLEFIAAATLIALSVPLHLVLRLLGRRGFFTAEGGSFSYALDLQGLRKAP